MKNFEKILPLLLKDEGGYTNDPDDNGGATNYGITLTDYRKYIKASGTADDVKKMTVDQAKVIYKSKYWDALNCDAMSNGVDYTCFDYGVNSGLGRPRKALGKFKDLSGTKLIDAINDERMTFLQAIAKGHNQKFLKGWTNRVSRVRAYSKELANKKDNTTGPIAAVGLAGSFYGLLQFVQVHEIVLTIAGILAAVIAGVIIHKIRNRK